MMTFASARERNHSRLRHSSRNLPLKLSPTPFCQACWARLMRCRCPARQSRTAEPWKRTPDRCRCAGRPARVLAHQTRQHSITRASGYGVHVDRQPFLGELVGHRQALELLAVGAAVEHEVVGPHLVRSRRCLWPRTSRSDALARPFTRHLQSRRLPKPPCSTWAHLVSVPTEKDANTSIAKARILRRQRLHPLDHRRIGRHRSKSADSGLGMAYLQILGLVRRRRYQLE